MVNPVLRNGANGLAGALLVLLFGANATTARGEHRLVASWTRKAPVVDGRLDEAVWARAAEADGFALLNTGDRPARPETSVKVLTDGVCLFLGFRCADPSMGALVSRPRSRDGQVFLDDSVEVILDPTNERRTLFHLAANAHGSAWDTSATVRRSAVTEDEKWNGSWKVATSRGADSWVAEWRIPLAELGIPDRFPVTLGVNLCRTRPRGVLEFSSWSPCGVRFVEPESLGEIVIPDSSGQSYAGLLPTGREIVRGRPLVVRQGPPPLPRAGMVRYEVALTGPDGAVQSGHSADFALPDRGTITVPLPVLPNADGPHRLVARLRDAQTSQPLAVVTRDYEVRPELELKVNPSDLYSHRFAVTLRVRHPGASAPRSEIRLALVGDGGFPVESRTVSLPRGGSIPVAFSLRGRPAGKYQAKAELHLRGRILASGASAPLAYHPAPKVALGPDGYLRCGGRPFFPVGMYTLQDRGGRHDDLLALARAAGFNTTVFYAYGLPDLVPLMDAAARTGIHAFVYGTDPYRLRESRSTRAGVVRDLDARTTHPALLGWYLVDEPEGIGEADPFTVRSYYETVKATDPHHPCSLVVMSPAAAGLYADAADVVWVDPYPVPDLPVTYVSDCVEGVRKSVGPDKPVWAVLQAFDWNVWRNGVISGVHRPTPGEERCMTYLALVHGAKGIIYWAYTGSKYFIRDYPDHWQVMLRLAGELRELSPVLMSGLRAPRLTITPPRATLDTMVRRHAGSYYVFAVNRETSACKAALRLEGPRPARPIEVLFENRTVTARADGTWQDTFDPLAVHVYRVGAR